MKTRKLFKGFVGLFVCLLIASTFCTVFADVEVDGSEVIPEQPEMTKQQRLEGTVYLQHLNYAAACEGVLTVIKPDDKTVTPIYNENKFEKCGEYCTKCAKNEESIICFIYIITRFTFISYAIALAFNFIITLNTF